MATDRRPAPADLGKTTRAYVKAMGWRSVNLHTHISLVNRYVYVEVPKAGCGTMKSTLGGMEAARFGPSFVDQVQANPHDRKAQSPFVRPFTLPSAVLEEALRSRKWKRFTVVRDPASRLLSGYLEKILQGLRQSGPIMELLTERGTPVDSAADISFAQFVDVVSSIPSRHQDPHWRRQADHIGYGIVDYDAIIHLEDLDQSWGRIGDLVRVPDLHGEFFCKYSTKASTRVGDYFTAELRQQVAQAYADDYRAFGYPLP